MMKQHVQTQGYKLTTLIACYFILHIVFFVYLDQPEESYIPKSKRTRLSKLWKYVQGTGSSMVDRLHTFVNLHCYTDERKRMRIVRKQLLELKRQSCTRRSQLLAFWAVAMTASTNNDQARSVHFDTDSGEVGIDNRCSGCISSFIDDFEGPLEESGRIIKGFGETKTRNIMMCTLVWSWLDDGEMEHKFRIPKSFYVKTTEPTRLLSPQHWAQQLKSNGDGKAKEVTDDRTCTLFWNDGDSRLTAPLDSKTNVATFRLLPGYSKFAAFCAALDISTYEEEDLGEHNDILLADPTWISDDEDDDENDPNIEQMLTGRQPIDSRG